MKEETMTDETNIETETVTTEPEQPYVTATVPDEPETVQQLYYCPNEQTFYDSTVHDTVPNTAIAITAEQHISLLAAINSGAKILDDLSIVPKPSEAHEWTGNKWQLNKAKAAELLAHNKQTMIIQLADKVDSLKSSILVGYPQAEIDSFYRQEKEALAWQADHNAETPMLKQIATVRGVPFELLVQKVLEKSVQFATLIGVIIGQRQAFEDRVNAAESQDDLDKINSEVEQWQLPNLE